MAVTADFRLEWYIIAAALTASTCRFRGALFLTASRLFAAALPT